MSEWKKVKLGDLATKITKGTTPSNIGESFCDRGIPFIRSELITQNKYVSDVGLLYISKETHEKLKRSQLEANDILFSMAGVYLGKTAILRECDVPANTNQAVALIRLDPVLCNVGFIYYYLNQESVIRYVNQISGQAAQPNINLQQIGEIPIVIPSRKEQDSIATILSRYDTLIENYQKQIKLLEEAAQRLYKEWFVDLRFPGYENVKMVDGLPEGWERKRLGDITCKFATGLNPRKNFVLGRGNNYYVTIKNMSNNDVIFDERCDKVDDEALEKINKRSDLQMGDLLFSGIGTIGRVYLIDKPVKDWNISESVFTMRPNVDIPSTFLYLTLLDKEIQDYCQSNAHGCAQKGIRMADLKAFEIKLPSASVLSAFSEIATPIIKQAKAKTSQIHLLTEARDRLLPRLMGGEKL